MRRGDQLDQEACQLPRTVWGGPKCLTLLAGLPAAENGLGAVQNA